MAWSYTPFVIPLLIAVLISLSLVLFIWRRRRARGAVPFLVLAAGLSVWALSYILEIGGTDFAVKTLGFRLSFVGIVCVPTAWLVFSIQYAGRTALIRWPRWLVFIFVPVVTLALVWTWDSHHLFWTDIQVVDYGSYSSLQTTYGPLFYVHAAYSYIFMLAGTVILLYAHFGLPRPFYQQKIVLVLSTLFAWSANLLYVLKVLPFANVDLTPFAFAVSGLGIAWSLFGLRLFDLIPQGRESVFQDLSDGIILVDRLGRIRDLNQSAVEILSAEPVDLVGRSAVAALPQFTDLEVRLQRNAAASEDPVPESDIPVEYAIETPEGRREYMLEVSSLQTRGGDPGGWIVELHDITDQKLAAAYLRRRTSFLEVFNQIVSAANTADHLGTLLEVAVNALIKLLDVPQVGLMIRSYSVQIGLDAEVAQLFTECRDLLLEAQFSTDSQVLLQASNLRDDFSESDSALAPLVSSLSDAGSVSALIVSVGVVDSPLGCLLIATDTPRFWSDDEIDLLKAVGRQIGLVADRLIHHEETQTRSLLMARLIEQSTSLNRNYTVNEVIPVIKKAVIELLEPDHVDLILGESAEAARLLEVSGPDPVDIPERDSADPRPVLVQDVSKVLGLMEADENIPAPDYKAMGSWPLVYQDRTLAVVTLYYDQPHNWSQAALDVMQAFTRQAAVALESARLFDAEREQHILAEALRDLVTVVNSTLDYDEVLEKILENLGWVLPHDMADVMLVEDGFGRIVHSRGYEKVGLEAWVESFVLPIEDVPVMEEIIRTGDVGMLTDTLNAPEWYDFHPEKLVRAYLGATITRKGRAAGLINIYSRKPGDYLPRHKETLRTFSNQVGIALENARLYAGLQDQAEETSALYRAVTRLFTPGGDQRTLASEIVQAVTSEFKSDHCSLLVLDEISGGLEILAQSGYQQTNPKRMQLDGSGLTVEAFKTGEVVYAPDVSKDARYISGTSKTRSEIVFPLRFQGEVMGVLNLESPAIEGFDERERRLLAAFADRAAMALENARLFELNDVQLRQINLLNSITRASLESFDFPIMLAVIVDRFRDLFNASGCYIALWDDDQDTVLPGMGSQIEDELELHIPPKPGEASLVDLVLNARKPLTIDKLSTTNRVSSRLVDRYGDYALMGLPLVVSQQKLGAIILLYEHPHRFLPIEMRLAEQAAGQVALAIARARSLEASHRRAQEAENLRQATAALAAALDLRQVLDNILDHLEQVIPYDRACVYLLEEQTLHAVAVSGFETEQQVLGYNFPASNALAQQIMIMSHPLILEDAAVEPRFTGWLETNYVHSWMGVPLIIHGSLIGFLTLGGQVPGTYGREQASLAQAFANQAAAAIANARLYSEVQRLAITDPLTGLYNRRGFSEIGYREVERARRYKRPLSVIMLDIDHFKNVNDTYKHAVGDEVLRILAKRCRDRTREVDILGRYGGEEIVILLPETDRAGGLQAAEYLRRDVAEEPFETEVGPLWITISLGVTDSMGGECELEELVDRADAAMYAAKQAGRNRVMSY